MMQSPMWQIGGLGPAQNFHRYATENVPGRLLSGMERRLDGRDYLAGDHFIADIASFPWVRIHKMPNQSLDDLPLVTRWYTAIRYWPAVERGLPSPYLLVGTDRYRSGKFVRDGVFNLEWSIASSAAPGCCAR